MRREEGKMGDLLFKVRGTDEENRDGKRQSWLKRTTVRVGRHVYHHKHRHASGECCLLAPLY